MRFQLKTTLIILIASINILNAFVVKAEESISKQKNEQMSRSENSEIIQYYYLNGFQAVISGASICNNNKYCLKRMNATQNWLCAYDACETADNSKSPTTCFRSQLEKYSLEAKSEISYLMCNMIKNPNTTTLKDFIKLVPSASETGTIELIAYLSAIRKSSLTCQSIIKDYLGPYSSKWNYKWYAALSGCRILGGQTTREKEEKDLYTWIGVTQGIHKCSDISIAEMRTACETPGATSPMPIQE